MILDENHQLVVLQQQKQFNVNNLGHVFCAQLTAPISSNMSRHIPLSPTHYHFTSLDPHIQ